MEADIKKYLEAKQLMASLEEKIAKYRQRIIDHMHAVQAIKLDVEHYRAQLRTVTTEHISKRDVPLEIWSRFSRPSTVEQLVVVDTTKPRRRSPSHH